MRYRCEVLTPLHVGTGQTLIPMEYLADGWFAVVNQEALFRVAPGEAENLTRQLVALSPEAIQRLSLNQVLPAPLRERQDLYRYQCALSAYVKAQLNRARERGQAEVRVITKTPDDRAYLPGTSLKGALRTALAYAWARGDAQALAALKRAPTREKWRAVEGLLRGGTGTDVTRDVLRALEVGDSAAMPADECLAVAHEAVLSAAVRRGASVRGDAHAAWKGFPTFIETIKPGVVLEGRIVLRDRLLAPPVSERMEWTPRQQALSLGEILDAVNLLATDVIAWEERYLGRVTGVDLDPVRRFYERLSERVRTAGGNEAYLCLGRGAGWHKSTVGLLLEEAQDFDFARFRREGGTAERRGPGFDRTDFEFPKTRKLTMEGGGRPFAPLGWVRVVLPDLPTRPRVSVESTVASPTSVAAPPRVQLPAAQRPEGPPDPTVALGPPRRPGPPSPAALRPPQPPKTAPPPAQPKPSKLSKAAEKAKREQERIRRRYSGEEEPK